MKTYHFVLEDPHKILYKYILAVLSITLIMTIPMFLSGLFRDNNLYGLIPFGFFTVFMIPISFLFNRKCIIHLDEEKIEIQSSDHKFKLPDIQMSILWNDIEGIVRQRYGARRNMQMYSSITFKLKKNSTLIKIIANFDDFDFNDFEIKFRSRVMNVIVPENPGIIKFLIRKKLS